MAAMTRSFTTGRIAILPVCVAIGALLGGCVRYEVVHYAPLTRMLDGKSELHISSYPSWFPRETSNVPFLHKTVRTPESVYFQVFVRDAEKQAGPNPHVESIRIRSFAYRRPGLEPVQLISDYDEAFWMQGQPQYNPNKTEPVPCLPGLPIDITISLTLNGVDYAFEDTMICAEKTRTGSLIVHTFAR